MTSQERAFREFSDFAAKLRGDEKCEDLDLLGGCFTLRCVPPECSVKASGSGDAG